MSTRGRGRKRSHSNSASGRGGGGGRGDSLLSGGFTTKPKFYKYVNAEVLLDSIYPGGPPPDFAGRLYHYHVVRYNGRNDASDENAVYVLRYEGKCIMPDGNTWATYGAASSGILCKIAGVL